MKIAVTLARNEKQSVSRCCGPVLIILLHLVNVLMECEQKGNLFQGFDFCALGSVQWAHLFVLLVLLGEGYLVSSLYSVTLLTSLF